MARRPSGKARKPSCLVDQCNRPAERRGLCNACRMQAYRKIASGEVTEEWLIENGLLLPKSTGRGKLSQAIAARRG